MSEHVFRTHHHGIPVEIRMGWNQSLQGFFVIVDRLNAGGRANGEPVIDSRVSSDPHPRRLRPLIEAVESLGLHVPDGMVRDVIADANGNVGRRFVDHTVSVTPAAAAG